MKEKEKEKEKEKRWIILIILVFVLMYWRSTTRHHLRHQRVRDIVFIERSAHLPQTLQAFQEYRGWDRYPLLWSRRLRAFLSPTSSSPPLPLKVHFLLYATTATEHFCESVLSANSFGNTVTVVGWHQKWRGWRSKIEDTLLHVRTLPRDNLVVFSDGYDVHYQGRKEDFIRKFLSLNSPIIMGAEKNRWPRTHDTDLEYPNSSLPRYAYGPMTQLGDFDHEYNIPRFLNAGGLVGYVGYVEHFLSAMLDRVNELEALGAHVDDQEIASILYQSGKYYIKLDYEMELIMNMHYSAQDTEYVYNFEDGLLGGNGAHGLVYENGVQSWKPVPVHVHKITGSVPLLLHFNGNAKPLLLDYINDAWWRFTVDTTYFYTVDGESVQCKV